MKNNDPITAARHLRINLQNLSQEEHRFLVGLIEVFAGEESLIRRGLLTGQLIIQVKPDGSPVFVPQPIFNFNRKPHHHHD
jgi:hypothetical protein